MCRCCCLVASLAFVRPCELQLDRLLHPWDSLGKSTRVGCHALLQGIFPTQGLNPGLKHWQADFLPLSHQGSPYVCKCIDVSNIFILIIILSCSKKKKKRKMLPGRVREAIRSKFISWEALGGELRHSQTCQSYAEIQGQV